MVSIYCRHCNFKTSVSSTCRWIFLRFPSQTFEELFTFHLECSHAASNCKVSKASTSLWLVKWTIKTTWAFSTISQFSNSFRMWKRSVSRQTILTQSKSCQAPTADFGSLALKKLWIFYTRYLYLEHNIILRSINCHPNQMRNQYSNFTAVFCPGCLWISSQIGVLIPHLVWVTINAH